MITLTAGPSKGGIMLTRSRIAAALLLAGIMSLGGVDKLLAQRPQVVDSVSPSNAALEAYFARLRFLHDHASSDVRPLDWLRRDRQEIARVEPEASEYSDSSRGGRVVARIVNLGDAVPRFGLVRGGITYIWIQDDRDHPYAVYITTDSSTGRIMSRARADLHTSDSTEMIPKFREPIVRWRLSPAPPLRALALCMVRCRTGSWCYSDSLRATAASR